MAEYYSEHKGEEPAGGHIVNPGSPGKFETAFPRLQNLQQLAGSAPLIVTRAGKRFSKWVVRYCIIAVSIFTITVLIYNWTGRLVQAELVYGFITAFAVHLITVAWVTAVKEKAQGDDNAS